MELSYFAIIVGAIFVNNVVLAQFLGICPFLGVSSKVETSLGMGAAVTFVMALTSVVAWSIQTYVLVPLGIEYMQTIVFILVDRGSGADGGNHVEEGVSVALSGAWNFPAAHYDELCRAGRGDSDDLQGVQPVAEHRLFRGDGPSASHWRWCCSPVFASGSNWRMSPRPCRGFPWR